MNNVIFFNHRRRHHSLKFLESDFFSHNRNESFEEKLLFMGAVISIILSLVLCLIYLGIFYFIMCSISLLIGILLGVGEFYYFSNRGKKHLNIEFEPESITKEIYEIKKAA